jgi:hypothetical protein
MQPHKKIMLRSFAKSICVADSSAGTGNQLHRQAQAAQAQASNYTLEILTYH